MNPRTIIIDIIQRHQKEDRGEWKLAPIISLTEIEEKMENFFPFCDQLELGADAHPSFLEFDSNAQEVEEIVSLP